MSQDQVSIAKKQQDSRPVSQGSRPISIKSSSTHKRTQSPKAFTSISQVSNTLSEIHFKEGDTLLKEQNISQFYESYRQGFRNLKAQMAHNPAAFESRFTSRCAILLSQCQRHLDEKQPQAGKELAECILSLCQEASDGNASQIHITSSFMQTKVVQNLQFAPVRFNALNKLGLCERQLGNLQEALDSLTTAVDLGEQNGLNVGETWVNLAAVHMSMKNWRRGRHAAEEATKYLMQENEPPYQKKIARLLAIGYYNLGKCDEKLSDLQEAVESFRSGMKVLKAAGIDPQEQVYKSVSYAFLQAMKDLKDGITRKRFADQIEPRESVVTEAKAASENFQFKKYTVLKAGQQRPGTAMSMNRSRDRPQSGYRSPQSFQANPLSRSINLVSNSQARVQLMGSLQKSQEIVPNRSLQDSLDKGFFNTVGAGSTVVKIEKNLGNAPVKSPWVIRSKPNVNTPSKPPLKPPTHTATSSGNLHMRHTAPTQSGSQQFRVKHGSQEDRRSVEAGPTFNANNIKESESGLGVEESWDESGHNPSRAEENFHKRKSLAATDIMRQNRLQLAMDLKDINQKLIGMDLVPLRIPKNKIGYDEADEPNMQQVSSGKARYGETSSHRLRKGNTTGFSPLIKSGPQAPLLGSKKTLVVVRKQQSQSGRNSQDSAANSADVMTPTGLANPRQQISTESKPGIVPIFPKGKPVRGESLSEPSPKYSLQNGLQSKQSHNKNPKETAATKIQKNWRGGQVSHGRIKSFVRKRYPASTFVCCHYLKVPRDAPKSPALQLQPTKIMLFLHKDSYLLAYFLLPSMSPKFEVMSKMHNVLGQPDRLRLNATENLYYEVLKPVQPPQPAPPARGKLSLKNEQKPPVGEDTIRPLFQDDSSLDPTPNNKQRPVKALLIARKDVSQDDDLLQPLIPISASGRGSQIGDGEENSSPADKEIEQLKAQLLEDYLQDGMDSPIKVEQVEAVSKAHRQGRQTIEATAAEPERLRLQEQQKALQAEEARKLQEEQNRLLEEVKRLKEEKLKQEQELERQKAEAAEILRKQLEEAEQVKKKQEEEARVRAEELRKEIEAQKLLQQQEADRLKKLKEEAEQLRMQEEARQKAAKEQAEQLAKIEAERVRQQSERIALEAERKRIEAEKAEAEQKIIDAAKAESNRLAAEHAEAERKRLEAEKAEQKRLENEKAETERKMLEAQKAEAERLRIEAEKAEQERARIESERIEAEKREAQKMEAEKRAVELEILKQGMAKSLLKKGTSVKGATKAEVVTRRYGNISNLDEASRAKVKEEATAFLQDYLKYQKVTKEGYKNSRLFLGSIRAENPNNTYLIEAFKAVENPAQPGGHAEIWITGMGIIKLAVLKELRITDFSSIKQFAGKDLSKLDKQVVVEFLKNSVTVKNDSELVLLKPKNPSSSVATAKTNSKQTAEFGQLEAPFVVQTNSAHHIKTKLDDADNLHKNPVSPQSSGETPSHQSLNIGSAPLAANANADPAPAPTLNSPPQMRGSNSMRPPMIMITPAPSLSDILTPSPSSEIFSFWFFGSHGQKCQVIYKEPSPNSPVLEYMSDSGTFLGFEVCQSRVESKELIARLLRWSRDSKTPKIDYSKMSLYTSNAAVESAGLF